MSNIVNLTYEEIKNAIDNCLSVSEILRFLGYLPHVSYYKELRERCEELNLELPIYQTNLNSVKKLKDVLVENSTYNNKKLKERLIKEQILENICAICSQLPEWNSKPLVLQLDHINGINNDNRLENLRLLCPNCYTQTDTFCNKGKIREQNRLEKEKKSKKKYYYFM